MAETKETAILIDHERGEVIVDTSSRGMAGRLTRMKFEEIPKDPTALYRRFVGTIKQIGLRRPATPGKNRRPTHGFQPKHRRSLSSPTPT